MFNLSQATLTPGYRDGEIITRFIASKEDLSNFAHGAYDMLFHPNGTPRSTKGALHLDGELTNAQLFQFPNGVKIAAKSDLEEVELRAREDGKVAGTAVIRDPKIVALFNLGAPCEIEGTSPWVRVTAGNGHARASSMQKRTGKTKGRGGRPTNAERARRASETQSPTMSS
jgi:hypothetical protein